MIIVSVQKNNITNKGEFYMTNGNTIQRNHKDTVFHDLFSDKKNALSLYNALNGTEYEDAEDLEIS